jgi:hypothetical protein
MGIAVAEFSEGWYMDCDCALEECLISRLEEK